MLQKSSFGNTKLEIKVLLYSTLKQFKLIFCIESYYSNNKKKVVEETSKNFIGTSIYIT